MRNKIRVSDFFKEDYVNQASYDNLRKIASVIDGQKNASRKILYTIFEKNIRNEIKVSQLGAKVAEFAEYLHGSLDNVIIGLSQDYTGTNNIPLLMKRGNFGTRFSNEASAPRYIYTYGSKIFFETFKKEDNSILKEQTFEGRKIEPMFYVPTLPFLLINGSEGVSSGFAQKILPRNPEEIKKYIKEKIKNKTPKTADLTPWFSGFNGKIIKGKNPSQYEIRGVIEKISKNKVLITEVPIGYDLKSYINILDSLEEKKIIKSYIDKSEDDQFKFEVSFYSNVLNKLSNDEILSKLKLIKTVTENYTVIDENNKIKVYDTVEDVLNHYIRVKLEYMRKRKSYLINEYKKNISYERSKCIFIENVVNNKLKINGRTKKDIIADIEKERKIVKKDGNYDYLLGMNILSLTKEKMNELREHYKNLEKELKKLEETSAEQIWLNEINEINLRKYINYR